MSSAVERIVRATNHYRAALFAGYTSYGDLDTEGILMTAKTPVTTIEHGYKKSKYDQAFRIMKENATIFCANFVRAGVFLSMKRCL